jgi:hypothetical protein
MSQEFVLVRKHNIRDLLRLARYLALELDAGSLSKDQALTEVQLLHVVEALERELAEEMCSDWGPR